MATDPYAVGSWSCAYRVSPVQHLPTPTKLLEILQQIRGHETGWPVWLILGSRPEMKPRLVDGVIECWLDQTQDYDFWRADPHGRMFLIRKLQEDTREIRGAPPGRYLDLTIPIWRTGECLLHASRLAASLGAETVELSMRWSGLRGRELSTLASPMRMMMPGRIADQDTVQTALQIDAAAIGDTLPELVRRLTGPMYVCFDFFEPSTEVFTTEIDRMRRGV
jgi:hypothetical protein